MAIGGLVPEPPRKVRTSFIAPSRGQSVRSLIPSGLDHRQPDRAGLRSKLLDYEADEVLPMVAIVNPRNSRQVVRPGG